MKPAAAQILSYSSLSAAIHLYMIRAIKFDANDFYKIFLSAAFSVGGLYICYAILCLLSVIFVIFVIPETRQKSLEDISKTLKDAYLK